MSKPFDSVTRVLNRMFPDSWPKYMGINARSIEVCDTDLSTITSQADMLALIDKQWALHVENEVSYKANTGNRILEYNIFAGKSLKVPVRSVLVLLRPDADGPESTGTVSLRLPDGTNYLNFRYEVIRVWEIPAEKLFKGGLGLLPLAFIADIETDRLPALVEQAKDRLKRVTDSKMAAEIWTAIDVLMGLRYERQQVDNLLKGVRSMEESVTYQAIVEKGEKRGEKRGETNEARALLLKIGTQRFGAPSSRFLAKFQKIHDKAKLEDLVLRTFIVSSWTELFK